MVEVKKIDAPKNDKELLQSFLQPTSQANYNLKIDAEVIANRVFPEPIIFDPIKWAEEHGIFLWSKQKELLQSVVDNRYTAARACHEVGKSFAVSVLILAWIDAYKQDSFVVWSAPSGDQVSAIIGRELRDMVAKFNLNKCGIEVTGSNTIKYKGLLRGYGRKPADHNPAGLSGIHAPRPLVVLDEGGALPKNLFTGADTIIGNTAGRVVTIGNPDNPAGHFRSLFSPESKWNKIKISAFDSPNFTEEQIPEHVSSVLITPETVEEWKHDWGENSALYSSKVLAEFPVSTENAVFEYKVAENASGEVDTSSAARCLSVDVGGSGTDETAAYAIRANGDATLEFIEAQSDMMRLADRIYSWWRNNKEAFVVIDANGIGEGVYSRLRQLGVRVRGFYAQQSPRDNKTYANAKTEAAFETARAMLNNKIRIDIRDDILRGELANISSLQDNKGRFMLMSKENMAKLGFGSPNRVDALTMGVWELRLGVVRSKRVGLVPSKSIASLGGYAV